MKYTIDEFTFYGMKKEIHYPNSIAFAVLILGFISAHLIASANGWMLY